MKYAKRQIRRTRYEFILYTSAKERVKVNVLSDLSRLAAVLHLALSTKAKEAALCLGSQLSQASLDGHRSLEVMSPSEPAEVSCSTLQQLLVILLYSAECFGLLMDVAKPCKATESATFEMNLYRVSPTTFCPDTCYLPDSYCWVSKHSSFVLFPYPYP